MSAVARRTIAHSALRSTSRRPSAPGAGSRQFATVRSKQDAIDLCRHVHRQELGGIDVVSTIRAARAKAQEPTAPTQSHPTLRVALPEWIELQVRAGDLRAASGHFYAQRLAKWLYPHTLPDGRLLGDVPVDQVTREMLGAAIRKIREAGKSMSVVDQVRNPLRTYYRSLVETKVLPVNPAADLNYFVGRHASRRAGSRDFFRQEEGRPLMAAAKEHCPRWATFIMAGLLGGLRWGEAAALRKDDIEWRRGYLHVERTISDRGTKIERCKSGKDRWVKLSPALAEALRAHLEAVELEGAVKQWSPEQRARVFPTSQGNSLRYAYFVHEVWRPLLGKARLRYRSFHKTRHSFAAWSANDGADLKYLQAQLGHSNLSQMDVYAHAQPERHEHMAGRLDQYVTV